MTDDDPGQTVFAKDMVFEDIPCTECGKPSIEAKNLTFEPAEKEGWFRIFGEDGKCEKHSLYEIKENSEITFNKEKE